jgi:MoaA/NifB/PqqE/SkfB family radical SAM enzyme
MLQLLGYKITKRCLLQLQYCVANFIPKISAAILHCGMTQHGWNSDQHGG